MLEYHEQDNIYVHHIRYTPDMQDALAWMKQYREEIEEGVRAEMRRIALQKSKVEYITGIGGKENGSEY